MINTVCFREFEERDIEFVFKCKNDEKLNSMTVGEYHPFTYEEAENWVHGCTGEHETYKFWAICTNDDEKRIIGWVSLSQIDKFNQSACYHGIVIADTAYRDGFAWIETYSFILQYVFETLKLNRLYGSSIVGHKQSNVASDLFLFKVEGIQREAVVKGGEFYDVRQTSILKREYFENKRNGEYSMRAILKRLKSLRHK